MKESRKPRVPMEEQIKLINECRRSGLTDADWCRQQNIAPSTFYNWVSRCRKAASGSIEEPRYGHLDECRPVQDVVPVSIIPEQFPERHVSHILPPAGTYLDNSHTIEVVMQNVTIRIRNEVEPSLLTKTLHILQEALC